MESLVENNIVANDINDLCRLCGGMSQNFVPIFENDEISDLSCKINKYLPLKVCKNDALPTKICHTCATDIFNWDLFYSKCLNTDRQFQMIMVKETESQSYHEFVLDDIDEVEEVKNSLEHVLQKLVEDQEFVPEDAYEMREDTEGGSVAAEKVVQGQDVSLNRTALNETELQTDVQEKLHLTEEPVVARSFKEGDLLQSAVGFQTDSYGYRNSFSMSSDEETDSNDENYEPEYSKANSSNATKKCRIIRKKKTERCPYCGEALDVTIFNDHLKNEHCDLIFHCDVCHQYKARTELIAHMTMHALQAGDDSKNEKKKRKRSTPGTAGQKTKKLNCEECRKSYKDSQGLNYHIRTFHEQIKDFQCAICGKEFPSERCVRNHINSIHDQMKIYECHICKKLFKTDSTLYTHLKTHSDKFPFSCSICDKKFRFKHHLYNHEKVHENVKNFKCNVCDKTFVLRDNLTKHMKIHTSELKFQCKICGIKMKQRRYIAQHMKRVHA